MSAAPVEEEKGRELQPSRPPCRNCGGELTDQDCSPLVKNLTACLQAVK